MLDRSQLRPAGKLFKKQTKSSSKLRSVFDINNETNNSNSQCIGSFLPTPSKGDLMFQKDKNKCSKYQTVVASPKIKNSLIGNNELTEDIQSWEMSFKLLTILHTEYNIDLNCTGDPDDIFRITVQCDPKNNMNLLLFNGARSKNPVLSKKLKYNPCEPTPFKIEVQSSKEIKVYYSDQLVIDGTKSISHLRPDSWIEIKADYKSWAKIKQFHFFSHDINEFNEDQGLGENNDAYEKGENIISVLSIHNNYANQPNDLDLKPKDQSEKLLKVYKDKFDIPENRIHVIHDFKNKKDLFKKIGELKGSLEACDILIVHYGGHGVQIQAEENEKGHHYLIPDRFDEILTSGPDLDFHLKFSIPKTMEILDWISKLMESEEKTKFLHFTVDACKEYVLIDDLKKRGTSKYENIITFPKQESYNLYRLLRYSVGDGQLAPNTNGYTDRLIEIIGDRKLTEAKIYTTEFQKLFSFDLVDIDQQYSGHYYDKQGEKISSDARILTILNEFELSVNFHKFMNKNQ